MIVHFRKVGVVEPPLDTVTGMRSALSTRLVRSAYAGACLQAWNGVSNTDVGFDTNGNIDEAALVAHANANAGNAWVSTWYDQSGAGRDGLWISGVASRPKIVDSGAAIKMNGRVTLSFPGNAVFDILNSVFPGEIGYVNGFYVASSSQVSPDAGNILSASQGNVTTNRFNFRIREDQMSFNGVRRLNSDPTSSAVGALSASSNLRQFSFLLQYNDGDGLGWMNGTQYINDPAMTSAGLVDVGISARARIGASIATIPVQYLTGHISEVLLSVVDKSADRAFIEANQMAYYNL